VVDAANRKEEQTMIELGYTAAELEELFNPLITRELASIAAIDVALPHESHADYVYLYRSAKAGKQANVEQMQSMLRVAGGRPSTSAKVLATFLKMQTRTAEMIGTTPTLRAMRLAQTELMKRYEDTFAEVEGTVQKAIETCWHRAIAQWVVLTAHIAKRGALEIEERIHLPMPLECYFAGEEAKACMRCHFDRPGLNTPIERVDPHPYHYLCSGCVDETFAMFPPDIAEQSKRWPKRDWESRVFEKAMSRPSKIKAELGVMMKFSGLAPKLAPPPEPRDPATLKIEKIPKSEPAITEMYIPPSKSSDEQSYNELLFDFESVRENW
jgi:hypothetical protein